MTEIEIKPLEKIHSLGAFSCGEQRIDNYLKFTSKKEHKSHKIRIFVATKPANFTVCGYYSLTFIVWKTEEFPVTEKVARKFEKDGAVPAIYLAKLGVNTDDSHQGIGSALMKDAFKRCLTISEHAGIPTLTLEAINEEKAKWYEHLGFERFAPERLEMVIALSTLRKAVKA